MGYRAHPKPTPAVFLLASTNVSSVKRFALLVLALLVPATMAPTNDSSAATIDRLAESYWQYELQNDYFLRAQVGLSIETIRSISIEEEDRDAAQGKSILDALASVDAAGLDHDRWLTYRTLTFLASNAVARASTSGSRSRQRPTPGGVSSAR